jgi:pyrimidine-nucleoside phosphorylase
LLAYDVIIKKRNGGILSHQELSWFVEGFTSGKIQDYQVSAFIMAVYFRGMSPEELGAWTEAMLYSGTVLDLSFLPGPKVDKHSTGGVGDKVSLPLAPLVAAAGVYVPMISGRGLGHTGGTLDKLESIPGFSTQLDLSQFKNQLKQLGCALIGQTKEIAPADKKLYALRDVTATVDCIPLIASSIMSKKLAEGIDGLVLDVKTGMGAFMKSHEDAKVLARTMIDIGKVMNKKVIAWITAMDQPLGLCVGNALEVKESVEILRGEGPEDLRTLVLALGAEMLLLAKVETNREQAIVRLTRLLDNGEALARFIDIVVAQGGDPQSIEDLSRLPGANHEETVLSEKDGFILQIDALKTGASARLLGAGRQTMSDTIDPGAGIILHNKVGDKVEKNQPLFSLHTNSKKHLQAAKENMLSGIIIEDMPTQIRPLLVERIE